MGESALREIQEPDAGPLYALANAISGGLLFAAVERVCWASERLAEMAGFAASADLVGLPLSDLFSDTGDGLPGATERVFVECEFKRSDGSVRTVSCRFAEGVAPSDRATAWVIEDLSHLRTLERELFRLGQEIHGANREVAGLRERLRRESDEREDLLTVVSHELRTPVTIISGYNRLLLAEKIGPLNDEQRSFLVEGSKACQRLDLFIGNLMEASRQTSDGEVLEITHALLAPSVDEVIGLLRPLFDDAKLKVRVDIAGDADRARFDRTRLEQILINLLGNAIKFSPPGGVIEISTRATSRIREGGPERPCVEFCISDEGPGIAPAHRQRIFEPYVQVGEESGAGGLGLGLAICRRLVEAHGGAISAHGRPGGGSRFVFTIPVADAAAGIHEGGSS
jgi:signal transduction histidine kinase